MVLVVTGGYLFFFFSPFQVRAIEVSGNEKITNSQIQTFAWEHVNKELFGIRHKSIFSFDAPEFAKNLLVAFPGIGQASTSGRWFGNLNLQVIERKPVAIFCPQKSRQDCFLIDENGIIYEAVVPVSSDVIVRAEHSLEAPFFMGRKIVDKNIMFALVKVKENLNNNFKIQVREVLISSSLIFTTTEGWQIYVDPTLDIQMQITKLELLLKNEITPIVRKNLQYIYLQYKDRAYYK